MLKDKIYIEPVLIDDLFPWFKGYSDIKESIINKYSIYRRNFIGKDEVKNYAIKLSDYIKDDDNLIFPLMASAPILYALKELKIINKMNIFCLPCSRHPAISLPFPSDIVYSFLGHYSCSWKWEKFIKKIYKYRANRFVVVDFNCATGRTVLLIENIIRSENIGDLEMIFLSLIDEQTPDAKCCDDKTSFVKKERSPDYSSVVLKGYKSRFLSHLLYLELFDNQALEQQMEKLYKRFGNLTAFWSDPKVRKLSTHNYKILGIDSDWKSRVKFTEIEKCFNLEGNYLDIAQHDKILTEDSFFEFMENELL